MSSQRHVYIPRKRKQANADNNKVPTSSANTRGNKQQQPRFHGAFTGGFSAGYFNTVGTKEGWMPSQDKKKEQRLEDFMDDEDHADWGGPTRVRDEYATKNNVPPPESAMKDQGDLHGDISSTQKSRDLFLPPASMLTISHHTVGPRLLRRLGLREGGSVFVPDKTTTTNSTAIGTTTGPLGKEVENDDDTCENLAQVHLSRRRLRKIQLQPIQKLPEPKLDKCGLGFDPYKDAPEFQRYREKRKQQARQRASYDARGNTYRINDVAGPVDGNEKSNRAGHATSSRYPNDVGDNEYVSYETAEDFVGKRSAAGFALRDDEDNAYDDDDNGEPKSARLKGFKVGGEYNTEVYEHESSDEDGHVSNTALAYSRDLISNDPKVSDNNKKTVDVGSVFAAWAGTDQSSRGEKASSSSQVNALASDGRPPLPGFGFGECMNLNKRRYPDPDIPRDYTIQPHVFREHESPYVLQAISNAVKLEQREEHKSQIREQRETQGQIQQKKDVCSRPLSKVFSSLAEDMKRRFTSSTVDSSKKDESSTEISNVFPAGLHMPRPVEKKDDSSKDINVQKRESPMSKITITRTVEAFIPNPLVCKRFRVPIPTNARRNYDLIATDARKNSEAAYFKKEILAKSTQQNETKNEQFKRVDDTAKVAPENQANEEYESKGIDRPSMANLRSIFQAPSDESSSSEDEDSDEGGDKTELGVNQSQKASSEYSKDDRKSPAPLGDDIQTKEGSGVESREIVRSRSSSSREDEVEDFSSRSSDGDDESSRSMVEASRKRRKEKHRRKHRHHRKRHKRKRSRSIDTENYSDQSSSPDGEEKEERRKERRTREHKRRKRKKSSSSRNKSRKREKAEGR